MMHSSISIPDLYNLFLQHPQVTTDSRNCPEGSIFFALRGENFNGNIFAAKALENGCSYAVVDGPEFVVSERTLLVENGLKALQELAALHRRKLSQIPVLCITGTNGKTTTKELVAAVLSRKYNILYTEGNLNNAIGTPLTLLRLNACHELAVIEIGASHPGDIKELVDIAQPDYGLITNVGRAHLEGFGSFEGVVRTKGELYDYLREHRGKILLNAGNPYLTAISYGLDAIRYGLSATADADMSVTGKAVSSAPLFLEWSANGQTHTLHTHLIGAYNLENVLAAVTAGIVFGVDSDDITTAIETYIPSNHRSQLVQTAENVLIVDAYNANPSSMNAALDNFLPEADKSHAVIFGSMKELGSYSEEEHRTILQRIVTSSLGSALLIGDEFRQLETEAKQWQADATAKGRQVPALLYYQDTPHCREWIASHPFKGCTILLKGSHSNHLETITDIL